ncbi:MAG: cupin domain-containing protein [Rhizobiaceae bacterium]|nr:cupin domain-containing protein [Rhizobiaceae bacterium]
MGVRKASGGARACVIGALLCLASPALALDPGQPVVVTPLASTTQTAAGQPIVPPRRDVRVVASQFDIAPGARLPVHKHPFPRYAYVAQGTLTVTDVEAGTETTYKAGDFIVEMVERWHFGANTGKDPVRLIVIDQVEGDAQSTILKKP